MAFDWFSIGTSVLGMVGADKAARKAQDRADRYAEATKFKPFDVTTTTGGIEFDGESVKASLSPELQAEYDKLLSQSGAFGDQIGALDPFEAQKDLYEQQQALFAPAQERDRLALESRLLSQGLLGSTTGSQRSQALLEAQGQQDLARQAVAFDQAQKLQGTAQERQLKGLIGALALTEGQKGLIGEGRELGKERSVAALEGEGKKLETGISKDTGRADALGKVIGMFS